MLSRVCAGVRMSGLKAPLNGCSLATRALDWKDPLLLADTLLSDEERLVMVRLFVCLFCFVLFCFVLFCRCVFVFVFAFFGCDAVLCCCSLCWLNSAPFSGCTFG